MANRISEQSVGRLRSKNPVSASNRLPLLWLAMILVLWGIMRANSASGALGGPAKGSRAAAVQAETGAN